MQKTNILNFVKTRWGIIAFIVGYILVAQLSRLIFYSAPGSPAVVLAPAGIALAGVILYGYRFWPAIVAASSLNGLIGGVHPLVISMGALGSVLQAFAGLAILRKLKFNPAVTGLKDLSGIITVALVVTPIGPLFNRLGRWLIDAPAPTKLSLIWLGGVLSVLIITPFLVRWISYPRLERVRAQLAETIIVMLLLLAVTFVIFWTPYTRPGGIPMAIIQLVFFFWIALRMGTGRMTLAFFLTTILSLLGPYFGMVRPSPEEFSARIIGIELYIIIFGIFFYVITAIAEERDRAMAALKKNVNDLEEALQKISADDQRKNEFIAVLAHELRNPLAPMLSYLQLIKLKGTSSGESKDAVNNIEQQLQNMSRLLEDLLDVSRISEGKIKLDEETVDLKTVISGAIKSTQPLINSRNHTLTTRITSDQVQVIGDPLRLGQILINLLQNAAKYTEVGGHIWLTCDSEQKDIIIKVRDTGIGISEANLASIFDMFNQVDRSISRSQGGLGIGLRLAKKLTLLHGGDLSVRSEGRGRGSEFILRLPAVRKDVGPILESRARHEKDILDIQAAKGRKILIVDDNEAAADALAKLLTHVGHTVYVANDGSEAIKENNVLRPEVILLDIGLPGMDGYEVAKKIRKQGGFSGVMVAITGYGQKEDKDKAYSAGFDCHLTKPVGLADLQQLIP